MREFYLKNNLGEIFEFNYKTNCLINTISNVGFNRKIEFADYTNCYKKINEINEIDNINLGLIFLNGYKGYKEFLAFIERSDSFFLYYKSIDFKYAYVEIESLSKTELDGWTLKCNLKLKKLSYWFKNVTRDIKIDTEGGGKSFGFTYPFKYSNSISGRIKIENKGYAKAPLKFVLNGAFDNPEIRVYKDKKLVSRAKINYRSDNATLIIEASPLNQKIEIIEKGETKNAYEFQDFSADNFIFLDRGTFELEFKFNVAVPPECTIVMTEGYLGN